MATKKSHMKQQLAEENARLREALESIKRTVAVSVAVNDKILADIDAALTPLDGSYRREVFTAEWVEEESGT